MLARCSAVRVARQLRCSAGHHPVRCRAHVSGRRYASTANGGGPSTPPSGNGTANPSRSQGDMIPFARLTDELDEIAPRFEVEDGSIEILEGPTEFYAALKAKILGAKTRIYLSTLYIGKTEHELVATIRSALRSNPNLKISFLTDALRGTREAPDPTTASILAPLVSEFGPERVQIRVFHTPNLTGIRKKIIPKRINEGWGLQHMKLYGIDDEVILSGANLSEDYFTNRLDRYHVFHSRELTEYYERVHHVVSTISFDIQPDEKSASGYSMSWPATNPGPNPLEDSKGYISHASRLLVPLIRPTSAPIRREHEISSQHASKSRTFVYPIFQLTPLLQASNNSPEGQNVNRDDSQSTELPAITALLTHLRRPPFAPTRLTFTAGYFNPSAPLVDLLFAAVTESGESTSTSALQKPTRLDVIAASPWANGFYGSKGVSGMLPAAYTLLCRRFLEKAKQKEAPVRLREWRRGTVGELGAWTYHAKGIWVTMPSDAMRQQGDGVERDQISHSHKEQDKGVGEEPGPSITLVGSSNYTQRSSTLDLEANALVLTCEPALQRRLAEEVEWLGRDAAEVSLRDYERTERRVGLGVRLAMWITRVVGGAL